MRLFFQTVVWLVLLGFAAGRGAEDPVTPEPIWPLTLTDRFLTSNFMEHRDGRLHAGLDLKTNSRCGFAALAAEDGWVVRVRTGKGGGYGRAVYLRGRSGRTYVYAHLSRFADPLRALVRQAQNEQQRFQVDLSLAPNRLPVYRGETIGLTGQSGTLGPHLHF